MISWAVSGSCSIDQYQTTSAEKSQPSSYPQPSNGQNLAVCFNEISHFTNTEDNGMQVHTTLPTLYEIKDAQKILKLGRTTIWKLVKQGKLRAKRVGRRVLFTSQALQDFINS